MSQASFNDDAKSVVKAIQDGVDTAIIQIDGKEFVTRPVYLPPEKTNVGVLQIYSLEGLVEYLNQEVDADARGKITIVVNSPRTVSIRSQVANEKETRITWIDGDYETDTFPFERYLDHETFMVKAQALIVDSHDREKVLKLVGNLTTAAVQNSTDNGTSQTVVVETGVRKSDVELPNPVILAPRRTFPEVEQPESPFVLRVKQSREGLMPEIALFEADGGLWKLKAIQNIKKYLKDSLKEEFPIIG